MQLDAPIVAVTVYPSQARVVRRGRAELDAGTSTILVRDLPLTLLDDSVRVRGTSEGTSAVRIVGVDVGSRHHAEAPDDRVRAADVDLRDKQRIASELADTDAAEETRQSFLERLGNRAGGSFARSLADGQANPAALASFGDTLAAQLREVATRRRELAVQREDADRAVAAAQATLDDLRRQRDTTRREITVTVESDVAVGLDLELSYVVQGASWQPSYDARLDGTTVTVTWHGIVSQSTGEDWPECELALSTARPAVAATIPEPEPWYVGGPPVVYAAEMAMAPAGAGEMAQAAPARARKMSAVAVEAAAEQGPVAVTYRLARPTAVPADGAPHNTTITTVDLPAKLDYIAAPRRAEEAHLRATVSNDSTHSLLAGRVSVFHGADFVGTSFIDAVAPGDELELALGVDDRVVVERELVAREASKGGGILGVGGNVDKVAMTWRTTVTNRRDEATSVTVLDAVPHSRDAEVKVREVKIRPEPDERSDLDEVTWRADFEPGAVGTFEVSFLVEGPKGRAILGLD